MLFFRSVLYPHHCQLKKVEDCQNSSSCHPIIPSLDTFCIHTYLLTTYSGRGEHGILGWIEWFRIDYIYQVFPWVFSIINQTEVFGHILALEGHIFSRMFTHSNLFTRWKLASLLKSLEKYQPAYNSSLKITIFGPPKNKARNWFWQAQNLTWNSTKFR